MENKLSDYRILTIKDLCQLAGVSESTAKKIKKLIIQEFNLKRNKITLKHYKKFYCCE